MKKFLMKKMALELQELQCFLFTLNDFLLKRNCPSCTFDPKRGLTHPKQGIRSPEREIREIGGRNLFLPLSFVLPISFQFLSYFIKHVSLLNLLGTGLMIKIKDQGHLPSVGHHVCLLVCLFVCLFVCF